MEKVNILGVEIDNITCGDLLERLKSGGIVFTPNVDHIIKLQKDQEFRLAYQLADYVVCDSQIVIYASKLLGTPLQEKISGSDLFPAFYQRFKDDESVTIFLLGSAEGVAAIAQQRINEKVGRTMVIAAHSPSFGFESNPDECRAIIQLINQSGANTLAIGVGAPKQEKWIYAHKEQLLHTKRILAIGATIDFEAGAVRRSPGWMSRMGLEWLYRLLAEPGRLWKRYLLENPPFFWLILKQKFGLYQSP